MKSFIYKLINNQNGNVYLGYTKYKNILEYTMKMLESGTYANYKIVRDYKAGHSFKIEIVGDYSLDKMVKLYKELKPIYNIKPIIKKKVYKPEIDAYYTY